QYQLFDLCFYQYNFINQTLFDNRAKVSSVLGLFKSSPSATMGPRKVTIVGSGNWGSAIARIVGATTKNFPDEFDPTVRMWVRDSELELCNFVARPDVFEEIVGGEKLSQIINTRHENVKYLPGKIIPDNVVAVPDLVESCEEANILIFVVPHQFVRKICHQLEGKIGSDVQAISLIKGIAAKPDPREEGLAAPYAEKLGGVKLISDEIKEILNIDNVVACAAGFTDGLGYGDNTKAAVIRLGLMEITKFVEHYYPGSNLETFFESCGIADLITTCYGGRNRKVCEAFAKTGKPLVQIEKEMLHGQSAQGPLTAHEVFFMTQKSGVSEKFPLFTAVHRICQGELKPADMISCLREHPEYM
ncbi:glycerol-3-phosphate dehydrogenase [NAD(P)+ ], partial [Teladorsagia circumcincta]